MSSLQSDSSLQPQPFRMVCATPLISLSAMTTPPPNTHTFSQFVALYDYDPLKCSPSDNPDFELELKEGSLVKVFGQEMADGFMVGEVSRHSSQASPVLTAFSLSLTS